MRDEKKSACKISDDQLKRFAVFYDALKVRPIAKSEVPGLVGLNDKQVDIFIFLFSLRYPLFEDATGRGRGKKITYGLLGAPYESQFIGAKAQGVKQ